MSLDVSLKVGQLDVYTRSDNCSIAPDHIPAFWKGPDDASYRQTTMAAAGLSDERVAEQAATLPQTRLVYVADRQGDIAALMQRAMRWASPLTG